MHEVSTVEERAEPRVPVGEEDAAARFEGPRRDSPQQPVELERAAAPLRGCESEEAGPVFARRDLALAWREEDGSERDALELACLEGGQGERGLRVPTAVWVGERTA